MTQDERIAEQLEAEYLAWAEKKWAADQKRLKSILEAWGAK